MSEAILRRAYYELVASFLGQPDLSVFEQNVQKFANNIDIERLSEAVVTYQSGNANPSNGQDKGLWLLAHFVALLRAKPGGSLHSVNLKALYLQLSALSSQIRLGFNRGGEEAPTEDQDTIPRYVHDEISSLVRKEGITDLLERFTLYVLCFIYTPSSSTSTDSG
jgi:ubiquitin-protein ligase E3 C